MIQERIGEVRVRIRADAGDAAERARGRLVLIRPLPPGGRVGKRVLDMP
jgi:hypothetical protein